MSIEKTPGHWRLLPAGFDDAITRVTEALKGEGFGIITTIDLRATFKEKLGVDVRPYRILGACNPKFAHAALQADPKMGVLLPCNVVVHEQDDGRVAVGAIDPLQSVGAHAEQEELRTLAREVASRLERVLNALAPG